jgi:hypothetical protein
MVNNCILFFSLVLILMVTPVVFTFYRLKKKGKWYQYFVIFSILFFIVTGTSIYIISDLLDVNCYCSLFDAKLDILLILSGYFFIMSIPCFLMLLIGSFFWILNIKRSITR